jgi:predicted aminopeptidase
VDWRPNLPDEPTSALKELHHRDPAPLRVLARCARARRWSLVLALALVVGVLSGCQTLSFYKQALKGQYQLFAHQERVEKLLADPHLPSSLRAKLQLVQDLRRFAGQELNLPVDGHYRKYVDVHRPFVVWNVEAAPEFSLESKTWWYPLVGSLKYRGYFSESMARDYANALRQKGYDVYTGGVEAYSTLGWFKDPVLNTFILLPEADLAETLFHELGHQRVFARGDTDFNEAFATTVGQEGARRWLRFKRDTGGYDSYLAELGRTTQFVHLIMETRQHLEALYGDQRTEDGKLKAAKKPPLPTEDLRRQKQQVIEQLQKRYGQLKAQWGGDQGYGPWFAHEINNAKLNSVANYYDLVPGFEHLLNSNSGDLEKFYQAVERLSKKPKKERQTALRAWGSASGNGLELKSP